jgi:hypothetical protein
LRKQYKGGLAFQVRADGPNPAGDTVQLASFQPVGSELLFSQLQLSMH